MSNAKYIGREGSVRPWIRKTRREAAGAHRAAPLKGRKRRDRHGAGAGDRGQDAARSPAQHHLGARPMEAA
jgi:hypothetical protein